MFDFKWFFLLKNSDSHRVQSLSLFCYGFECDTNVLDMKWAKRRKWARKHSNSSSQLQSVVSFETIRELFVIRFAATDKSWSIFVIYEYT